MVCGPKIMRNPSSQRFAGCCAADTASSTSERRPAGRRAVTSLFTTAMFAGRRLHSGGVAVKNGSQVMVRHLESGRDELKRGGRMQGGPMIRSSQDNLSGTPNFDPRGHAEINDKNGGDVSCLGARRARWCRRWRRSFPLSARSPARACIRVPASDKLPRDPSNVDAADCAPLAARVSRFILGNAEGLHPQSQVLRRAFGSDVASGK